MVQDFRIAWRTRGGAGGTDAVRRKPRFSRRGAVLFIVATSAALWAVLWLLVAYLI